MKHRFTSVRFPLAVLSLALCALAVPVIAQTATSPATLPNAPVAVTPAVTATPVYWPDAEAFGGSGYGSLPTTHFYGAVGLAKKTAFTNGSGNLPVYSYSEVKAYRTTVNGKSSQATDFTTGLLFPFYDRVLYGFRVTLAVDGNAGVTQAVNNVGYVVGAKAVAQITRGTSPLSFVVSADPSRSSVTGVHTSRAFFGVSYDISKLKAKL